MPEVDLAAALRGTPWAGTDGVPYPRADPANFDRLPIDTWATAAVPAGVRLELELDGVSSLGIDYTATTADVGYRGAGAGTQFCVWTADAEVAACGAEVGRHRAMLDVRGVTGRVTVYLPEGMRPRIHAIIADGGRARPASRGRRWTCYGDSIAEGWVASGPAGSWPAILARRHGLDLVNLGYAGAARGEIVSAEHVAALSADVISLTHGTNCWSRTPHSVAQVAAGYDAFLDVVRASHPSTPVVCVSPVIRPDAESSPNKLGATLAGLRAAIEDVVERRCAGDPSLHLVRGIALLDAGDLADGVHPGDRGHAKLAGVIGAEIAAVLR